MSVNIPQTANNTDTNKNKPLKRKYVTVAEGAALAMIAHPYMRANIPKIAFTACIIPVTHSMHLSQHLSSDESEFETMLIIMFYRVLRK
mmetsp:Transcript_36094/g.52920  ORF Transcript_36094/g.52920 Transcript_36094/m.52920 type:complete len:89 (-) Transcript_36094:226-492(-)